MKLIFIYGPPAVGKLTVAEILSQRTGVCLFHNHLSRDLVRDIYQDKLDDNYALVDKIRLDVLDHCSKHNTDLIFTYAYEGPSDDHSVKQFIQTIEDNNGEVVFIELVAHRDDLIDRVTNDSRKRYKKLTDPVIMSEITENMSKYTIPFVDAIKVDTSQLNPNEAADFIAKALNMALANDNTA